MKKKMMCDVTITGLLTGDIQTFKEMIDQWFDETTVTFSPAYESKDIVVAETHRTRAAPKSQSQQKRTSGLPRYVDCIFLCVKQHHPNPVPARVIIDYCVSCGRAKGGVSPRINDLLGESDSPHAGILMKVTVDGLPHSHYALTELGIRTEYLTNADHEWAKKRAADDLLNGRGRPHGQA